LASPEVEQNKNHVNEYHTSIYDCTYCTKLCLEKNMAPSLYDKEVKRHQSYCRYLLYWIFDFMLCKIIWYVQHILTPGPRFRIRIILGSWILSRVRI